jgi:hypothetical protein
MRHEECVYYLDLETAIQLAELSQDCDLENRSLQEHLISIIEYFIDVYDYVVLFDGEWEIELHQYLSKCQKHAILRRAGL